MAVDKRGPEIVTKFLFWRAWLTSTTVSETFGEGRIENVANIRSGYSCIAEVRTTRRNRTSSHPRTHLTQL
jgi:hypothetical protein